jgi:hypothetical protein
VPSAYFLGWFSSEEFDAVGAIGFFAPIILHAARVPKKPQARVSRGREQRDTAHVGDGLGGVGGYGLFRSEMATIHAKMRSADTIVDDDRAPRAS